MNIEIITISFVCLIIVKLLNLNLHEKIKLKNSKLDNNEPDIDYDLNLEPSDNKNNLFLKNQPAIQSKNRCSMNFISRQNLQNIPNNIKIQFNKIVVALFCDLRKKGLKYKLLEYDTGKVINFNNNYRFIMNVFIYNEITQVTKKVEMDIIKLENGIVKVLGIRDGTSLDYLEDRPISTQSKINRLSQYKNINGKLDSKLEYTLLNTEMKLVNNELVCDPKVSIINKKGYASFPCRKQLDMWDSNGINETQEQSKTCYGINSTDTNRINNTNSVVLGHKGSKNYNWLFRLNAGNPSYPRSGFGKV
jgi:hypothetical protein